MLVLGDVAGDLLAVARVGPQLLRLAVGVARDDRVRRVEDRLRRAVVLLEQDRRRVRVVALELEDVADRRAAEGVDRLVGVADDGELGGRVLPRGGCASVRAPGRTARGWCPGTRRRGRGGTAAGSAARRPGAPAAAGRSVMIRSSKSSACASVQPTLVARVDVADDLLRRGARLVRPLLGRDEFVLEVADLRGDGTGRVALRVEVEIAGHHRRAGAASRPRRRSRTTTSGRARAPSLRRIRTHIEWNVDTHMVRARGPTSRATRSFISPAALLVKVIARIS